MEEVGWKEKEVQGKLLDKLLNIMPWLKTKKQQKSFLFVEQQLH